MIIYLYHKRHRKTGLNYFGKTTTDPSTYGGSGKYWVSHLKKYGADIETVQVWKFDNINECSKFAISFSIYNNIVESKDWANLKIENGLDGGFSGYRWYTKDSEEKLCLDSPGPGWVAGRKNNTPCNKGMYWFNNGIEQKFDINPPGPEWTKGMLPNPSRNLPRGPYSEERNRKNSIAQKTRKNIKKYKFIHEDFGIIYGSTGDLLRLHPTLYRSGIFKLIKKKITEFKGWKIV